MELTKGVAKKFVIIKLGGAILTHKVDFNVARLS
jgi:hypothetical protein